MPGRIGVAAMNRRQQRLQRIANVAQEFLAARTAAEWLRNCQEKDPSFGNEYGWDAKAGIDFYENMEATYIVRMYAEFEAGLRDYWKTYLKQGTHPKMVQLVNHAIPNQHFSQDIIDDADEVRVYRNYLVHDIEDEVPAGVRRFTVATAKRCLCAYFGRLDARWQ
jgi:hypothetical protein